MVACSTPERILEAAEGLMLEKSFHSVGLNEILAEVQVPKGSFYHHFSSKEQFGVALLTHYVARATAFKTQALLSPSPEPDPMRRLMAFLGSNVDRLVENDGRCPCLVVKLSAEVANFSEPMRLVLQQGVREWVSIYETLLREGVAKGSVNADIDPAVFAPMIVDLWNGAIQRASITRNPAPLRNAITFLRNRLNPT